MKKVLLVIAAVLIGLAVFRGCSNVEAKNDPPVSCQLLGGQWSIVNGWECGVSDSAPAPVPVASTPDPLPKSSYPVMTNDCSVTNGQLWLRIFNDSSDALNFQIVSVTYTDAEGNQIEVDNTPDVTLSAQLGGNDIEQVAGPPATPGTNATTPVLGQVSAPSGATGCTADITYSDAQQDAGQ